MSTSPGFGGAQGGAGIRGEEGFPVPAARMMAPAFLQVTDRAASDEGLADAVNADGGHEPRGLAIASIVSCSAEREDVASMPM